MEQSHQKRGYLLEAFRLFHMRDIPGEKIEAHYHEFCKLLVVVSGTGGYWIGGERYQLQSGDAVLIDSRLVHRPEFEKEYERVILYISPEFLRDASSADCDLQSCFAAGRPVLRLSAGEQDRLLGLVRRLEEELASGEPGKDIVSRGLLLRLLVELYRGMRREGAAAVRPLRPSDGRIAEMLRYIDGHLGEELTVEHLSEHFFLSKYHMMRLFRDNTGSTIHAYILERRLTAARDMIAGGLRATEACYRAGFNSYCAFCRAYNKRFGRSPTGRADRKLRAEATYE